MLFGAALGEYMWTVVADAAERPAAARWASMRDLFRTRRCGAGAASSRTRTTS